jgi:hypothetical protein
MRQGYEGTLLVTRYLATAGSEFSSEVGRVATSVLTGALVIGAGHLMGTSTCRGLGDDSANRLSDDAVRPATRPETFRMDAVPPAIFSNARQPMTAA